MGDGTGLIGCPSFPSPLSPLVQHNHNWRNDVASSMTRQHYRAVAAFICEIEDRVERKRTCLAAISYLRQFNSNFDRYKFEEACGINEEEQ
jgi:hypothetical protein